jgi:DNA gyrase/topoisomerase IV subunit B
MYFGRSGPAAIPKILSWLVQGLLDEYGLRRGSRVLINIGGGVRQEFNIEFFNLARKPLSALLPDPWLKMSGPLSQPLSFAVAASERCVLSVAQRGMVKELVLADRRKSKTRTLRKRGAPDFAVRLRLHGPAFGQLRLGDFHRLAGILQEQAVLRPGLSILLSQHKPEMQCQWQYIEGLAGYLEELDHSRWPIHPGQIVVFAAEGGLKLELRLRFVHAGIPEVRNWVNFEPTQGGAHLEGFGDALQALFPEARTGCRVVNFVTNADSGASVKLPHPFIAALHLQMDAPKYEGPTRDILMDDGVRKFVREAICAVLPKQWEELKNRRV